MASNGPIPSANARVSHRFRIAEEEAEGLGEDVVAPPTPAAWWLSDVTKSRRIGVQNLNGKLALVGSRSRFLLQNRGKSNFFAFQATTRRETETESS